MNVFGRNVVLATMVTALATAGLSAGEASKPSDERLLKRIPAGYAFYEEALGDLNGDGADDCAIIVRATDKSNIKRMSTSDAWDCTEEEEKEGECQTVDLNPRGLMIFFKNGDDYQLAFEKHDFLEPVPFPTRTTSAMSGPSLYVEIKKGNLFIRYSERTGEWRYTFRYKNSKFELIGYDASNNYDGTAKSINYTARKKLEKNFGERIAGFDGCQGCKNKPKERWSNIAIKRRAFLRDSSWNIDIKENPGTIDTFTDVRDGKTYWTTKIGGQIWMAENLNYQPKKGGSWCYDTSSYNCDTYGRLYDWKTAKTACPAGYRLPTYEDWIALVTTAGGWQTGSEKLKAADGWMDFNGRNSNGMDIYGFSALPGGTRGVAGDYSTLGYWGYWWTATEYSEGNAYNLAVGYREYTVEPGYGEANVGFSVRCVKDAR